MKIFCLCHVFWWYRAKFFGLQNLKNIKFMYFEWIALPIQVKKIVMYFDFRCGFWTVLVNSFTHVKNSTMYFGKHIYIYIYNLYNSFKWSCTLINNIINNYTGLKKTPYYWLYAYAANNILWFNWTCHVFWHMWLEVSYDI